MIHQLSNSGKSNKGYSFNFEVKEILLKLLEKHFIKSYTYEPRYKFPGYEKEQFSPDGEIILNDNKIIIIDNTTSIRHDRLKQKQWDAHGIKKYYSINYPFSEIEYYVIIPNIDNIDNTDTEMKNIIREKNKIFSSYYYSEIDNILHISELIDLIFKK